MAGSIAATATAIPAAATTVAAATATTVSTTTTAAVAAASAAAAAVSTIAPTTTAAATAGRFGPSLVYCNGAAVQFGTIQLLDRLFGFGIISHRDEREAAGAPRFAIHDHGHLVDITVLTERFLQGLLGRRIGNVTHVQFHNGLQAATASRPAQFHRGH